MNKAAFCREQLTNNPNIQPKEINEAWQAAGNTDKIDSGSVRDARKQLQQLKSDPVKQQSKADLPPEANGALEAMDEATNGHDRAVDEANVLDILAIIRSDSSKAKLGKPATFDIDMIEFGDAAKQREMSSKIVKEYAEAMKNGSKFPRPVVFMLDRRPVLVAGHHRLGAQRELGNHQIDVIVVVGATYCEAVAFSARSNLHGHSLSPTDKRKAVAMMLLSPVWSKRSSTWIGRICGSTCPTVEKVRKQMEADGVIAIGVRIGIDGSKHLPPAPKEKIKPKKTTKEPKGGMFSGSVDEAMLEFENWGDDQRAEFLDLIGSDTPDTPATPEQTIRDMDDEMAVKWMKAAFEALSVHAKGEHFKQLDETVEK